MAAQGLASRFPIHELAVMGLLEVLPRLAQLRRRLSETVADIAARRPAVVVTIDSPGFTLRLLREVAPFGIRRAHYVAPQVWAWRGGRVRHYPGLWDRLLCLLPFEPTSSPATGSQPVSSVTPCWRAARIRATPPGSARVTGFPPPHAWSS